MFEVSIGDTARLIASIMNVDVTIQTENVRLRPSNSEVNRLYGDNTLLKELTGWQPSFGGLDGFERGLKKTIEWFSDNSNLAYYPHSNYSI